MGSVRGVEIGLCPVRTGVWRSAIGMLDGENVRGVGECADLGVMECDAECYVGACKGGVCEV